MTTYPCPKGHASTEPDYCSDCGTRIDLATVAVASAAVTAAVTLSTIAPAAIGSIPCPACGTPHLPTDGNFCEICGYNFKTGTSGDQPISLTPSLAAPPIDIPPDLHPSTLTPTTSPLPTPPLPTPTTGQWQIQITIDPSLAAPESPPAPVQPPLSLSLSREANLIGRTSAARANYPEIALDFDDAVSHRHAVLTIAADNSLILRDIGSANGTYVNGIEIKALVDIPLKPGDSFTLGHWTKITVNYV